MCNPVGKSAPAVLGSVLLVGAAVSVSEPSHLLRSGDERTWIGGLDHLRVRNDLVAQLFEGLPVRMDVAMGVVPEARLVVHNVIPPPAAARRSPDADEVLHPGLLIGNING